MAINTRLTQKLNLEWPIISAPMAIAGGGKLAAEVTRGGGLGLIGGGYGDSEFIGQAFQDAGNSRVGIGFITWSLAKQPELLDQALEHSPDVVMLSFGDPSIFSQKIKQAGATLICQCQTIAQLSQALDAGADIVVAQGGEAGGHGGIRGTMNFVPEASDLLKTHSPDTLLLAAGGIGDGRGIAASLMLGADGVLIGSRYWASKEALVSNAFQKAALAASGDETLQTDIPDVARGLEWPTGNEIRVLKNRLMEEFHPRSKQLSHDELAELKAKYLSANPNDNAQEGGIIVGEVAGIIRDIPGAGVLTRRLGIETKIALSTAY
ncbi:MAG: nitronate monooxygenase [Rhizobiaceae bacterium]|nr:nitronate monooxygenase [Rhizobiaceae bacterium]